MTLAASELDSNPGPGPHESGSGSQPRLAVAAGRWLGDERTAPAAASNPSRFTTRGTPVTVAASSQAGPSLGGHLSESGRAAAFTAASRRAACPRSAESSRLRLGAEGRRSSAVTRARGLGPGALAVQPDTTAAQPQPGYQQYRGTAGTAVSLAEPESARARDRKGRQLSPPRHSRHGRKRCVRPLAPWQRDSARASRPANLGKVQTEARIGSRRVSWFDLCACAWQASLLAGCSGPVLLQDGLGGSRSTGRKDSFAAWPSIKSKQNLTLSYITSGWPSILHLPTPGQEIPRQQNVFLPDPK